jgi:hypothetical protein
MKESSDFSEFREGVIRINCAQESVDILGGPWEVKQKKKETDGKSLSPKSETCA